MVKFKINKLKCAGCGACIKACPYRAISIKEDGKAVIDIKKCQGCGECKEICPFNAIIIIAGHDIFLTINNASSFSFS